MKDLSQSRILIVETFNSSEIVYREAPCLEQLVSLSGRDAQTLLRSIREHAGGHPQSDHFAMLGSGRGI